MSEEDKITVICIAIILIMATLIIYLCTNYYTKKDIRHLEHELKIKQIEMYDEKKTEGQVNNYD